jgi:hypothetical protein
MKKFVCILIEIICLFSSNAYACNATMQKVELYYSAEVANRDMNKHLENGWFIHTCAMSTTYNRYEYILVVYEK